MIIYGPDLHVTSAHSKTTSMTDSVPWQPQQPTNIATEDTPLHQLSSALSISQSPD